MTQEAAKTLVNELSLDDIITLKGQISDQIYAEMSNQPDEIIMDVIADTLNVSDVKFLQCNFGTKREVYNWLNEESSTYDDSMDGDFDSGMTSAGFGTDEDYGYFGDEY